MVKVAYRPTELQLVNSNHTSPHVHEFQNM